MHCRCLLGILSSCSSVNAQPLGAWTRLAWYQVFKMVFCGYCRAQQCQRQWNEQKMWELSKWCNCGRFLPFEYTVELQLNTTMVHWGKKVLLITKGLLEIQEIIYPGFNAGVWWLYEFSLAERKLLWCYKKMCHGSGIDDMKHLATAPSLWGLFAARYVCIVLSASALHSTANTSSSHHYIITCHCPRTPVNWNSMLQILMLPEIKAYLLLSAPYEFYTIR